MAIDKVKLNNLLNSIEKQYGKGSFSTMSSQIKIPRWTTGIQDLDAILGGGLPWGRIIEISGVPGSGKTSLLYHLLSLHEMAVAIPIEGAFDMDRAIIFGNKEGQLIVRRAYTGEQVFETIDKLSECGVPIVGVDSVPHMIPEKQYDEDDYTKSTPMGRVALLIADKMPRTVHKVETSGMSLILINQVRKEVGATMYQEQYHTPGGLSLEHNCSVRLKASRKEWIKIPNKNPKSTAKDEFVGLIMKIKVTKSKVSNPFGECEIPLFFDRGFVSFEDIELIRKELMEAQRNKHKATEATEEEIEENVENHIKPISTAEAKERLKSMTKKKKKG